MTDNPASECQVQVREEGRENAVHGYTAKVWHCDAIREYNDAEVSVQRDIYTSPVQCTCEEQSELWDREIRGFGLASELIRQHGLLACETATVLNML